MDRRLLVVTAVLVAGLHLSSDPRADAPRLDAALLARLRAPHGSSQVIIRTTTNLPIDDVVREAGGTTIRSLGAASVVALVPDGALARLAANPRVASVSADRRVTSAAAAGGVLDRIARLPQALGVDGAGCADHRQVAAALHCRLKLART